MIYVYKYMLIINHESRTRYKIQHSSLIFMDFQRSLAWHECGREYEYEYEYECGREYEYECGREYEYEYEYDYYE